MRKLKNIFQKDNIPISISVICDKIQNYCFSKKIFIAEDDTDLLKLSKEISLIFNDNNLHENFYKDFKYLEKYYNKNKYMLLGATNNKKVNYILLKYGLVEKAHQDVNYVVFRCFSNNNFDKFILPIIQKIVDENKLEIKINYDIINKRQKAFDEYINKGIYIDELFDYYLNT